MGTRRQSERKALGEKWKNFVNGGMMPVVDKQF